MGNEVGTIGASAFDDTLIYNEKSNWNNGSLAISSTDGATIYLVGYRPVDGAAKVEVGAKIMADSLFANMTSLTSVVLPSSLVRIPDRLFFGCTSLKTLLIPSSVTSIGALSFKGCSSLSLFFSASSLPSTFSNDFSYGAKGYYWYSGNANYDGHHWHYVDGVPTVWVKPA